MCSDDILFFVNVFCWTFDPRKKKIGERVVPFITYPFQDVAFLKIRQSLGVQDVLFEKSRDQGASWMGITAIDHSFLFDKMVSHLLLSRNVDLVDKTEDPKSLMWKIDFLHSYMPHWLLPPMNRINLHFLNKESGNTIDGVAAVGDFATGDRRTSIFMDEFARFELEQGKRALAASQFATECRIFNSTAKGTDNSFYDIGKQMKKHRPEQVIRMHWTDHPIYRRGLYKKNTAGLRIIDRDYWLEKAGVQYHVGMTNKQIADAARATGYKFVKGGGERSPWYDEQCLRTPDPRIIAEELDINYLGADSPFFPEDLLEGLKKNCREPIAVGDLLYTYPGFMDTEFVHHPEGKLKLWVEPNAFGQLTSDRFYVVGADVAQGTGATNSVAYVGDCTTGEFVAELAISTLRPDQFANYLYALSQWFKGGSDAGAYLIWEANGPGRGVNSRIVDDIHYDNIYWKRAEDSSRKKHTDIPGWWSSKQTKLNLFISAKAALSDNKMIVRSAECFNELREWRFDKQGQLMHVKSKAAPDPSGARENHSDRAVACAVTWHGMKIRPETAPEVARKIPPDCIYAMRQKRLNEQKEQLEPEYQGW